MSHRDDPRDPLFAYRLQQGPPPGAAAANWQQLVRRIDAGEPAPVLAGEPESPHRRPHPRSRAWAIVLAAAAAALIVARLAWPERFAARGRDAASAAPYHHTPDPSPRGVLAPEPLPSGRTDASDPVPSDIPLPAPAAPPALQRPAASSMVDRPDASSDLSRELALVRSAARAVRDGDGAAALRHADDYLARHPKGGFVPEARLQRIDALCLLGRAAEARAEVTTFLAAYPDSPLRERVQSACISSDGSPALRPSPDR